MKQIIDVNAYVGAWPYWEIENRSAKDLLERAAENSIDQMWVTSLRAVLMDWTEGNEETYRICEQAPDKLIPILTISPFWVDDARHYLDTYADRGIFGVRLFPVFHGYSVGEYKELLTILRWINERKIPIIYSMRLFMNWGIRAGSISDVETIAKHTPNCPTILSGVNWGEIMAALTLVERFPNLHFDISCLALRRGIDLLLREAGPERVLFGTGMPFQNPKPILDHLKCLSAPDETLRLIFGGNAASMMESMKGTSQCN
jgi:uncharacterized protein